MTCLQTMLKIISWRCFQHSHYAVWMSSTSTSFQGYSKLWEHKKVRSEENTGYSTICFRSLGQKSLDTRCCV